MGALQSDYAAGRRGVTLVEEVTRDGATYRKVAKDNDVEHSLVYQYSQEAKDLAKEDLKQIWMNAVRRKISDVEVNPFDFYDISPEVNFSREEAKKLCNSEAPDHVVAEMLYQMTHPLRLKPPSELTEAQRAGVRRINATKYGVTYDFKNTAADEDILVRLIKPKDSSNGGRVPKTTAEDDCSEILRLLEEGGVDVSDGAREELTKALPGRGTAGGVDAIPEAKAELESALGLGGNDDEG